MEVLALMVIAIFLAESKKWPWHLRSHFLQSVEPRGCLESGIGSRMYVNVSPPAAENHCKVNELPVLQNGCGQPAL